MYLARKVWSPNHELLGAVIAGLELRSFETRFASFAADQSISVALVRDDGTLVAQFPHFEDAIGRRAPQGELFEPVVTNPDSARLTAVQPVKLYPGVIAVSVAASTVLAPWRSATAIPRHRGFPSAPPDRRDFAPDRAPARPLRDGIERAIRPIEGSSSAARHRSARGRARAGPRTVAAEKTRTRRCGRQHAAGPRYVRRGSTARRLQRALHRDVRSHSGNCSARPRVARNYRLPHRKRWTCRGRKSAYQRGARNRAGGHTLETSSRNFPTAVQSTS